MLNTYGLDLEYVENKLCALENNVKLLLFKRETDCHHCTATHRLLEKIASITHKIEFEFYNFTINQDKDHEYQILTIPAIAIIGAKDYGIRHYGYPHGAGLNDFIDDIVYISKGKIKLVPQLTENLLLVKKPIHLKLFVSPNCPYSIPLAKVGLKLAIASDLISVDIIHADEFMELAEKYNVRGIPMTVVNESKSFYGNWDIEEYLQHILELI